MSAGNQKIGGSVLRVAVNKLGCLTSSAIAQMHLSRIPRKL